MSEKTQAQILEFYAERHKQSGSKAMVSFCGFLDRLFAERDLSEYYFYTSMVTFCLMRFRNIESRDKPMLALRPASSLKVQLEFRVRESLQPAIRTLTHTSNAKYDIALDEFDRLREMFEAAH